MKNSPCALFCRLAIVTVACFSLPSRTTAAGLTVNPSSISNTYSGAITLQATGLTNGETVLIERFLDANNNSAVDAGELLVQSFQVTDGQVTAFGGVRDTHVPGDDDGAADAQIQTATYFHTSTEFSRLAGRHVFRLSSPGGRFAPVIQPLNVTQGAFGQGVAGQITSGGSPVPYAAAALLVQVGDEVEFVAGALADVSGNFTLQCAAGTYLLLAAKNGYVSDFSTAPVIVVNPGSTLTQNATLTAPTRTISGRVSDVSSGDGIGGVQLFVESANDTITFGFTDANGDFTASVLADQWGIGTSDFGLAQIGYLRPQNEPQADTTTGNVTGINIQLAKETALIYGSLKNDTNAPLPGVFLFANDNNNQYQSEVTTDAAGNYVMGVTGGMWFVGPDNNNPGLAGYLVQSTNVTITNGQAVQVNFVAQRSTAHLTGRVIDNGGAPVSDLTLIAFNPNGGSSASTTAGDGSFDLGVFGGSWTVQLETSGASQRNLIGPSLTFTVTDGVDVTNITYVVQTLTAQISGAVRDGQSNAVANLFVHASATINGTNYNQSTETDAGGNYQIGVINGTWQVQPDCSGLSGRGYSCVNSQSVTVSGANQPANFTVQAFANTRPTLGQLQFSPGQFQFRLSGEEGRDYRIEATTDFAGWTPLTTNRVIGGSFNFIDGGVPGVGRRFYRGVLVP